MMRVPWVLTLQLGLLVAVVGGPPSLRGSTAATSAGRERTRWLTRVACETLTARVGPPGTSDGPPCGDAWGAVPRDLALRAPAPLVGAVGVATAATVVRRWRRPTPQGSEG